LLKNRCLPLGCLTQPINRRSLKQISSEAFALIGKPAIDVGDGALARRPVGGPDHRGSFVSTTSPFLGPEMTDFNMWTWNSRVFPGIETH
jgi:hypothetical protein